MSVLSMSASPRPMPAATLPAALGPILDFLDMAGIA
ncbi:MAG: hypothetical protein QOJ53_1885, partial [Sphingomonadales bacterium]|nr:hypothetical protein [Sphingomonadales bacterium]